MPTFAGLRGTGSFAPDERPKNFREFILWRDPAGRAPLTALLSKVKTEATDDPEFAWWEEKLNIVRMEHDNAAGMAPTDTAVTVISGALQLVPGDILQVEPAVQTSDYSTVELIKVATVVNDTSFTVVRGQAGSTAGNIPDGAYFTRIGSAFGEGTSSPSTVSSNPTKLRNFTQIFKTPFSITRTAAHTKTRTGDVLANERKRKAFHHSEKLEQAWFWGKAFETLDSNGMPLRYTGGLREFITTHQKVYAATPTEDQLLDDISPIFDFQTDGAGDERIVFAGNLALNTLNKIAKNSPSTRINFNGILDVFGMKLTRLILPQGTLLIRTHPLLNVHPVYNKSMFILNMAGLVYRPLSGRDTKVETEIQGNDEDLRKDQWITEAGLEVRHEETMMYIGNLV